MMRTEMQSAKHANSFGGRILSPSARYGARPVPDRSPIVPPPVVPYRVYNPPIVTRTIAGLVQDRLRTPPNSSRCSGCSIETFVEEIPQHPPNAERRHVDRFHDENLYLIAVTGDAVVGTIALRGNRPFSLDQKLGNVDALPARGPAGVRAAAAGGRARVPHRPRVSRPRGGRRPRGSRAGLRPGHHFRHHAAGQAVPASGLSSPLARWSGPRRRRFSRCTSPSNASWRKRPAIVTDTRAREFPARPGADRAGRAGRVRASRRSITATRSSSRRSAAPSPGCAG